MDQEILDKLATGEYEISPRSGRLRKRVRIKKKKSFFSRRRVKKYGRYALWILLIAAFLFSLVIVIPELNIVSDSKKSNQEKTNNFKQMPGQNP
ncbi:MAG: hypothetical protein IT242_10775 [Bacteroidia bacterium]|nr:hypothetical protein [Bacteroidia bacterium]